MIWHIRVWLARSEVIAAIYGQSNGFYRRHMLSFSPDRLRRLDYDVVAAIYNQVLFEEDLNKNRELFELTRIHLIPIAEEAKSKGG
ncbi:hypothetical protein K8R42_00010 [bacterium]|nr:hypothetical protein [bacterium]